jgi:hypothetical protein
MTVEAVRNFLFWCTVIDYGILLIWCVVFKVLHDTHYKLTRWWFPVQVETYDEINLKGVAFFKLAILLFNLVPYVALRLAV